MQRIVISEETKVRLRALLKKHATYASFSRAKNDAFEYTSAIGLRVCPYCNINYTYTVYEKRNADGVGGTHIPVVRPDFDHFVAKTRKTTLSKTLENLIPCCQQCNSRIKGRKDFKHSTHVHPFLDDFDSIKRFSIDLVSPSISKLSSFTLSFSDRSPNNAADVARADRSIDDLRLIPRYQYHKEEVVTLFETAQFYHKEKLKEIKGLVGLRKSANLRRHLFSDTSSDINKKPLSKLRSDVLSIILKNL